MDEYESIERAAKYYDSSISFDRYYIEYEAKLIAEYDKGPKVLEMGCASGVMTQFLVDIYPDVSVVDASIQYFERIRSRFGTRVRAFHSLFEEFEPNENYNTIILARALEHVKDPVVILRHASAWLVPGGKIHVIVPNAESLHRRVGKSMGIISELTDLTAQDKVVGHRRVYTAESLRKTVEQSGLSIVHEKGIYLKPFPNAQMEGWSRELINAFFELGKELPNYCAEIYAILSLDN